VPDLLENYSDNELYQLFLEGNKEAMQVIVKRNSPRLFNFIYRMIPDRPVCEEFVQEVFLKLVRAKPDFSGGTKVSTYLFYVARNLAIDEIRRRKLRHNISINGNREEEDQRTMLEKIPDRRWEPDSGATRSELKRRVEECLSSLPEEQREVFILREVEGLEFSKIAEILGCNENTVKSRMRYALEKLREGLKDFL